MAQDPGEVTSAASTDVEQIKAEIEETRAGMSETIDEIQERLRPANLARQAGGSLKDATVARARNLADRASSAADEFRAHPAEAGAEAMRMVNENHGVAAVLGIAAAILGLRAMRSGRKTTGYLMGAAAGIAGWSLWQAYERGRDR